MKGKHSRARTALVLLAFGFMLVVLVIALFTDGRQLGSVVGSLKPYALVGAFLCAAISYFSIVESFSALLRISQHKVGFWRLSAITLISTTFNFVVSTGGLSSIAVRLYLFKKENVKVSVMLPISVAQSMLTNLVLAIYCCFGLLYLETQNGFQTGTAQLFIWGALGFLLILVGLTAIVFFHPPTRRKVIWSLLSAWRWFEKKRSGHIQKRKDSHLILQNMEQSIRLLHQGWKPLGFGLFWVSLDWGFTALTLGACFEAVGVHLSAGSLMVGFALAFLSTTANILPGGLGVMEGLLTVTYAHFGIPAEKALVAALLFRVFYFIIPLALSAILYLDTMKRLMRGEYEKV
jgi:uncharacterized protein (TIRG00374 family)